MHSESGRMKTSRMLIGVTIAIGSVKLCSHPLPPFARMPAASIRMILIKDRAIVTFISFVGGFTPNTPMIFAKPMNSSTVDMYSLYCRACSPSISPVKLSSQLTMHSAASCLLPGFLTFMFLVSQIHRNVMIAMTTHVITTDSAIWIFPPIVKAVSTVSSSTSL